MFIDRETMSAVIIKSAGKNEAELISEIGKQSYRETYPAILTTEQIDFMLNKNYTVDAIRALMDDSHDFYLLYEDAVVKGFISIQSIEQYILRIEKLYLLAEVKGRGYGKKLVDYVGQLANSKNLKLLELNVNRSNPAYHFYLKQGFVVKEIVDIPYYGYVLDDYIMQKDLKL